MVALQILCKCLSVGNIDIIENNQLSEEYFTGYEEERNFIVDHFKQYGNTPDSATFLSKFPDLDLVEVTESDRYLVETIREEYLYYKSVPVVQKIAELLKTDANAAAEYMIHAIKELQPEYNLGGTDIVAKAKIRYNEFIERKQKQEEWFFTTGLPELDDAMHGIQRVEEFMLIYARTNQGKSWLLNKILTHIWEIGFNVGYISWEMGDSSIGYRFDTLHNHFDNRGLVWGNDSVDDKEYEKYIEDLTTHKNKFIVGTPKQLGNTITISKLRNWVKQYKLDVIAIDGIGYLSDERFKRGDNKTTSLTNISEDLMSLSIEMKIPILGVVQANRSGVVTSESEDLPELDSIRDSDGMSFNASKVIALRQNKDGDLMLQIKKHRNGFVGRKIAYHWNANIGEFINIPINEEFQTERKTQKPERSAKKKQSEKEDVF